jgi:Undecaprenyl-phosphate glucose phosphotransferase
MELGHHTRPLELLYSDEDRQSGCDPNLECISAHRFAATLILSDALVVFISGCIPAYLYEGVGSTAAPSYILLGGAALPLFLLSAQASRAYAATEIFIPRQLMMRAALAIVLLFSILMGAAVATKTSEYYSRVWFFAWFCLSMILVLSSRLVLLALVESRLANGACLQRAIIISYGEGTLSRDQLALDTRNHIRAVATVTIRDLTSAPELGPYLRQFSPQVVILSLPLWQVETAMCQMKALSQSAVEVLVLPQDQTCFQNGLRLRRFGQQTLLQISEPPLAEWDRLIKRTEDVIVASLALLMISPVLILTALAIKLESNGPVLFKQIRAGFNGELIEVWKFRSMYVEASDPHASCQTSKNDRRVTHVGRFIRKTSVDELPQFWNVLQGTMSIVGPRPHALETSAGGKMLDAVVDGYAARHRVKPGITGWAQVNGARGPLNSPEQVKQRVDFDLHYIENWSVMFDLKIIAMTAVQVLHDSSAY